jgi:hypothetical protein
MKELIMIVLMSLNFILLNGQVKKKEAYIDDLYMTNSLLKDSLERKNILDGLNIDQLNQYKRRAVVMRNTGIVLTTLGSATAIVSYFAMRKIAPEFIIGQIFNKDIGNREMNIAGVFFLTGCTITLVGIPVMLYGIKRIHNAEIAIMKLNTKTSNNDIVGLRLTIRF